jgi:hypothetical protein
MHRAPAILGLLLAALLAGCSSPAADLTGTSTTDGPSSEQGGAVVESPGQAAAAGETGSVAHPGPCRVSHSVIG